LQTLPVSRIIQLQAATSLKNVQPLLVLPDMLGKKKPFLFPAMTLFLPFTA
jgi:hypothetical protein